jgi:hypothetical protein
MGNIIFNYYAWLKVPDAALPRNIVGYIIQLCLGPLRAVPFTLLSYDEPEEIVKCGEHVGTRSFVPQDLPERKGPRPEVGKWMASHRQVSQLTNDDMHKICVLKYETSCIDNRYLLQTAIDQLVVERSSHVVVKTSTLEKTSDTIFVADSIATPHAIYIASSREIAHVHEGIHGGDYSLHILLSATDCKEVVTKKWGERMPLVGTLVLEQYIIIYTRRTKEEICLC